MALTLDTLSIYWHEKFGELPPLGYRLRQEFPARWFRIHSLPQAKRYAQSPLEYEEILKRQNTLLSDFLPGSAQVCLLLAEFGDARETDAVRLRQLETFQWAEFQSFAVEQERAEAFPPHIQVKWASLNFTPGILDALLLRAADDLERFLILNVEHEVILAPYDGGLDCLLATTEERDAAKQRYSPWLSTLPSGL
jgi:hypothetical protein